MVDDVIYVRLPVQLDSFLLARLQCGSRTLAKYTRLIRSERWLHLAFGPNWLIHKSVNQCENSGHPSRPSHVEPNQS